MTEIASAETWDAGPDVAEPTEYASETVAAPTVGPVPMAAALRQSDFGEGIRAELQFVMNMRQLGQVYVASHPTVQVQALVWRLIAAVAIAASVAACGLLLTTFALLGQAVEPNLIVAVSLLLVGLALLATVATAVNGRPPRLRKR